MTTLPGPKYGRWGFALVVSVIWCLGLLTVARDASLTDVIHDAPPRAPSAAGGALSDDPVSDHELHAALVDRVANGENYYAVLGEELRARGYPTGSVFNWRAPLPLWLFGILRHPWYARAGLFALGLAFLVASVVTQYSACGKAGIVCGIIGLAGTTIPALLPSSYVDHLQWVTLFLGLATCALAAQRPGWGVACGIAALLCRELALGFCLVAGWRAWRARRRREAAAWAIGIGIWAAYFLGHALIVRSLIAHETVAVDASSWLCWKSPWFWVRCARMNGLLIVLPGWCSYVFLTASLVGLAGARQPHGRLLFFVTMGYLVTFLAIAKPVNDYWGTLLNAPLALGCCWLPISLTRVWRWLFVPAQPNESVSKA